MRDQATSASAMMTSRNSSMSSLRLNVFAHLALSASPAPWPSLSLGGVYGVSGGGLQCIRLRPAKAGYYGEVGSAQSVSSLTVGGILR